MRVRIIPGGRLHGEATVPGDKSIAHRWLILAATARGSSRLVELPRSLDVRSMASCLSALTHHAGPALEVWASNDPAATEGHGSTWNGTSRQDTSTPLEVEGEGRSALVAPTRDLDCGNSGTAMRLLAGVVAAAPFHTVLVGDESLSSRPMERVAEPLRSMGARVATTERHAPVKIDGGGLEGIAYRSTSPSAQVKSAVLLAGLAADGATSVEESAPTRDHTERALAALGAPIEVTDAAIGLKAFQHEGFEARCPGDPSSAAFLVTAAALTRSDLTLRDVGLNPSRTHFLEVMARMGIQTDQRVEREELGEPVGDLHVAACPGIGPALVEAHELPLVIDEVPVLALLAAHAQGDTWFLGAGELRVKESDRLTAVARGITDLGGHASVEGNDLVVAGGGLEGGVGQAGRDHRMAMACAVAALAAQRPCEVDGMQWAEVSFPGFLSILRGLGARIEVVAP